MCEFCGVFEDGLAEGGYEEVEAAEVGLGVEGLVFGGFGDGENFADYELGADENWVVWVVEKKRNVVDFSIKFPILV